MQLVLLFFFPSKKPRNAPPDTLTFENRFLFVHREIAKRDIHRDTLHFSKLFHLLECPTVLRRRKGFDRILLQRFAVVGHNEIKIDARCIAKSLARRASAEGRIKTKKVGFRLLVCDTVILTNERF